ncbi:PREDICTED: serine/threonine-protein kinase Nek5-like [Polistes dominula]|uniref:non-specific serine/threonine protein kinase n=1 Tax=Polistes dominula TaxID=743375 RepID=A0ABM1J825_POLDO|nr:PREDICTED: serine/threonine-protein kinase Nek5-like [Polistes dominula]
MNHCIKEYKFEAVLGKGMFGTVHLVRRTKDLKPFVIKEQNLSVKTNLSFKMVLREVEYFQKMRHPNIVAYHAAWVENNKSYILMEYATRGTLKELLEKLSVPLREENALYLFSQITLGVHHIHSKKILHRDLKPENILLTGRKGEIVKITDFGVSKNILDESMCCAGSYYYMAPEMLSNQPYDLKSDIWSMGVILYEMVTKKLPFPASVIINNDLTEFTRMVYDKKPKPVDKNISISTIRLISKMLRKQSIYRPRTDQLILCPYLVPFIARAYLNLGRILQCNLGIKGKENFFDPQIFQYFFKTQR